MTQEEKELLLKDLCGRLTYGVQGITSEGEISPLLTRGEADWDILTSLNYRIVKHGWKPYLRSLSNMTEEEEKELSKKYVWNIWTGQIQIRYHSQGCWDDETECPTEEYIILFDWLNAHHFDYRGLIDKGIALESPENMYTL